MLDVFTSLVFKEEYFSGVLERKNTKKAIDFDREKAVVTGLRAIQMNLLMGLHRKAV